MKKELVDLKLKRDVATGTEKKALIEQIKQAEKSVAAMKIARKSMLKFNSSFEIGLKSTKNK